ncbi:MAG TPA: class I SAM-dependent methyltransferase [Steroidobacteraceae bacterium]
MSTGEMAEISGRRCGVCAAVGPHRQLILMESMFETFEPFRYFECHDCGCIQIADIPTDLRRYYPPGYYSLAPASHSGLQKRLKSAVLGYVGGEWSLLGALAYALRLRPVDVPWMEAAAVTTSSRILDVGCGSGGRLVDLSQAGYRNLLGVDLFLESDLTYESGLRIRKAELGQIEGVFDLIMLHHSLEHMPDPRGAISAASRLLAPGGMILVRVPVTGKWAWRHYGTDWVQLDPPRHLYTFSEKGIAILAAGAGLEVDKVLYDSEAFQFEGSERILRLRAQRGDGALPASTATGMSQAWMKRRARELNRARDGDQACFFLVRR